MPSLRIRAGDLPLRLFGLAVLAFLLLPTLIMVPVSFDSVHFIRFPPRDFSLRWYREYLADPEWMAATVFSLQIAALTMLAATVLGTMTAVALERGRLPGREAIRALLLAPLLVPHVVVAIAVYLQFTPIGLTGTTTGFVLIHTALAIPYVVLVVSASLARLDPTLDRAAMNLGASPTRAFFAVTLPLIRPGIFAAAVFAFLSSFDETVVAFFISGDRHKTLTRKMFEDIDMNLSPIIAAASTVIVVVTIALMWLGRSAAAQVSK
ncbi:ABC transporter permease [Allostella vacuolata]|nr:ABC transporter permease [Stella vacuolata]